MKERVHRETSSLRCGLLKEVSGWSSQSCSLINCKKPISIRGDAMKWRLESVIEDFFKLLRILEYTTVGHAKPACPTTYKTVLLGGTTRGIFCCGSIWEVHRAGHDRPLR